MEEIYLKDNRTPKEKSLDRLFLLYLIKTCESINYKLKGNVKLQKLAFLTKLTLKDKNKLGFFYTFFRWKHGPVSGELHNDLDSLINLRLVKKDERGIVISGFGKNALKKYKYIINQNVDFKKTINYVCETFAIPSTQTLVNSLYNFRMPFKDSVKRISEIPISEESILIEKFPNKFSNIKADIPSQELDSLEMCFDARMNKILERIKSELRSKKSYTASEVFN